MNYLAIISLVSFIATLFLGFFVFTKDTKKLLNRLFFCYCLTVAYSCFVSFNFHQAESFTSASFWLQGYVSLPFIMAFLVHFLLVFTEQKTILRKKPLLLFLYTPALVIFFLLLTTDILTRTPVPEPWGWSVTTPAPSPIVVLVNIWMPFMALCSLALSFVFLLRTHEPRKKRQAMFVFIGVSMHMVWGIVTQGVLPEFGIGFPQLASTGSFLAALFYGYAVIHHGLFTLTPTAAAEGIVATMSDALFLVSPDNTIEGINQATSRLLLYREDELANRPIGDVLENRDHESLSFEELHRRLVERGHITDVEMNLTTKDGNRTPVSLSASLLRDKKGIPFGTVLAARDITDRKQTERVLLEKEAQYREIFTAATDGFVIFDPQRNIVDVNPQACEMYGYPREEFLQLKVDDLIHPDFRAEYRQRLAEAELPPTQIHGDQIDVRKDGTPLYVELKGSKLAYKDSPQFLAVLRDIGGRKRAEEANARLEAQLQHSQKMEAIGTLAGGIAHDFNNILSSIIGFGELTKDGLAENDPALEDIEQVLLAGKRAKNLVRQILTFSLHGNDERTPLDPDVVVREALALLRASLPTTVDIRQNIDRCGYILGDATQMHQVVVNLCTNAYQSMDESAGVLEVTLKNVTIGTEDSPTETDGPVHFSSINPDLPPGDYIRLSVSDTGHGMTEEIKHRLFEPYFTTKKKDQGTGLGLAVVHGIVNNHGGAITVYSEPGEGSVFSVYLPRVAKTSGFPDRLIKEPIPTGTEHILLVDDEAPIVNMGKKILNRLGYTVTTQTSSIEALELFRKTPGQFDLVITDMAMPDLTGDKLAQKMMNIRPNIPIVLCTGFSDRITKEKAQTIGIREFAMKPLVKREMAGIVRKALDNDISPHDEETIS